MTFTTLEEVKKFLQLEEDDWNRLDRLVTKIFDNHPIRSLSGQKADSWYQRYVFPALREFNESVFDQLGEVVEDDQINEITAAVRKLVTVKKRNRKRRVQPARRSPSSPAKRAMSKSTAANMTDASSIIEDTEESDCFSVDDTSRDNMVHKRPRRGFSNAARTPVLGDRLSRHETLHSNRPRERSRHINSNLGHAFRSTLDLNDIGWRQSHTGLIDITLVIVETYVRSLVGDSVRVSQIPLRKLLNPKRAAANDRDATRLADLDWVSFQLWEQSIRDDLRFFSGHVHEPWTLTSIQASSCTPFLPNDHNLQAEIARQLAEAPHRSIIKLSIGAEKQAQESETLVIPDDDPATTVEIQQITESIVEPHIPPPTIHDSGSPLPMGTSGPTAKRNYQPSAEVAKLPGVEPNQNPSLTATGVRTRIVGVSTTKNLTQRSSNLLNDEESSSSSNESDLDSETESEGEEDADDDNEEEISRDEQIRNETFRVCEHNSPDEVKEVCEFFKITKDHMAPKFSLRLPGMSRELVIHQLAAVYWMYRQSQLGRTLGGWCLDEMGLGKTTEQLALLQTSRIFNVEYDDLQAARERGDWSEHVQPGDIESKCKAKTILACPCEPGSITHHFTPIRGPCLITTNSIVLPTYEKEWAKIMGGLPGEGRFQLRYMMHKPKPNGLTESQLSGLYGEFKPHKKFDGIYINARTSVAEPDQDQIVMITSSRIWHTTYVRPSGRENPVIERQKLGWLWGKVPNDNKELPSVMEIPVISWGWILNDECHKERGPGTGIVKTMYMYKEARVWGFTGTLLTGELKNDLGYTLPALSHGKAWSLDESLIHLTPEGHGTFKRTMTLHSRATKGVATKEEIDELLDIMKRSLPQIVIRRTRESYLVHHSDILNKGELNRQVIQCCAAGTKDRAAMNQIANQTVDQAASHNKMTWKRFFSYAGKLRVCCSYPYLAHILLNKENDLDGTDGALVSGGYYSEPLISSPENIIRSSMPLIIASSDKLQKFLELVSENLLGHGKKRKIVVMSELPVSVYVAYMAVIVTYQELKTRAYLMSPGRNAEERQDAADAFQGDNTEKEYDIFFTTTGKGGVGISLTAASIFVLMDPCWTTDQEEQAAYRLFRIGQEADEVTMIKYVVLSEWIEGNIMKRQKGRRVTSKKIFELAIGKLKAQIAEQGEE